MDKTRIDLPLLLPDVEDERDACVERLQSLLARERGIARTHVVGGNGSAKLCLHYDPSVVSLAQVSRLARVAGAKVTEGFGHAVLEIRAVDGEDAAKRIENGLLAVPGVLAASVNLAAQRARVEFERRQTSVEQVRAVLLAMGYGAAVIPQSHPTPTTAPPEPGRGGPARDRHAAEGADEEHDHAEHTTWYGRNKELVWSLIGGTLLLAGWAGQRWLNLPRPLAILLYLGSYGFGGFDLASHTIKSLRRGRFTFDIDLLMLLAAVGAAALGEWAEGAFLLFLFSLAHALEHYALGRARNAIRALSDLAPPKARVLRDGGEREIPVREVRVQDVVVVRPAERIPVDGTVRSGRSAVNQAPITGESVPVEKEPGNEVYAGTVNGDGGLEVVTTKAAGDRTLDRVVKLVEEAQTQKAPTQEFTNRFERVFVPAVLLAAALLIVLPPLLHLWGWGWATSFYRAMALLVAASPCALALGTPATVLTGIAQAARKGVLIKGGAHLENLGTLGAIAMDKTGTITMGRPEVTDVVPADGVTEAELLRVAAAVERRSQHPLAQAIVRRADERKLQLPEAGDLESLTARGVRSSVDGKRVEIGNLRLWEQDGVDVPGHVVASVGRLQSAGRSIVIVRHGDRFLGTIGVADRVRVGVPDVLKALRALGIATIVMLTGDNRGVGEAVAKEVGVDEVKAELLPEQKVDAVRELLARHGQVAMVGDGVNDAPALANATVGIAMGGAGTAVALETADVALMGDDLAKLPFAVGLSRKAKSVIRQNLYLSLAVIVLLILATTTGFFRIGAAVVLHEGSTLVVIMNALRLLAYEQSRVSPGPR